MIRQCSKKPYPRATGIFVDKRGVMWQVREIPGETWPDGNVRPKYYLHWSDEDSGGSFKEGDGVYTPMGPEELKIFWQAKEIHES